MIEDDVLREVREAREAFARRHGYDIGRMVAYLREQDARGDWPVARLTPPRPSESPRSAPGSPEAAGGEAGSTSDPVGAELVPEVEATREMEGITWLAIPNALLPEVRALLARERAD